MQELVLLLIHEDERFLLGKRSEIQGLKNEALSRPNKWYKKLFFWRREKDDPLEEKYAGKWLPPIEHKRIYESLIPWLGDSRVINRCLNNELRTDKKQMKKVGKYGIRMEDDGHNYKITAFLLKPTPGVKIRPNEENIEFQYFSTSEIRQIAPQNLVPYFDALVNGLMSPQSNADYINTPMSNVGNTEPYGLPLWL